MPSIPLTSSQRRLLKKFNTDPEWDAYVLQKFLNCAESRFVRISDLKDRACNARATMYVRKSGIFKDVD